jgi:hypothetical protein
VFDAKSNGQPRSPSQDRAVPQDPSLEAACSNDATSASMSSISLAFAAGVRKLSAGIADNAVKVLAKVLSLTYARVVPRDRAHHALLDRETPHDVLRGVRLVPA